MKKMLLNTQFYSSYKQYVGCNPMKNHHLGDCEDNDENEVYLIPGDCELPSMNEVTFILGDCGDVLDTNF